MIKELKERIEKDLEDLTIPALFFLYDKSNYMLFGFGFDIKYRKHSINKNVKQKTIRELKNMSHRELFLVNEISGLMLEKITAETISNSITK